MITITPPKHSTCSNCPKVNPSQTIVVKVDDPDHQDLPAIFQDAAQIVAQGHDLILVWGDRRKGCPQMDATQVVSHLQTLGVNAMGLNGQDGRLIQVRPVLGGLSGSQLVGSRTNADLWEIERVNMGLLCLLSGAGYTLVIDPLALGPEDGLVMVDGDQAALGIAIAVRADILLVVANPSEHVSNFGMHESSEREAHLARQGESLKEHLKGSLKTILLSDVAGPYPISGALWCHDGILPIRGINTVWMQSSLAT